MLTYTFVVEKTCNLWLVAFYQNLKQFSLIAMPTRKMWIFDISCEVAKEVTVLRFQRRRHAVYHFLDRLFSLAATIEHDVS
jgi:hypothetical protein